MNTKELIKRSAIAFAFFIIGIICFYVIPNQIKLSWNIVYLILGGIASISLGISFFISDKNIWLNTARFFSGILFTFSGFVKAVDPLGSKYKFIDYFDAWGIGFMNTSAFSLGILLSTIEFAVGLSLLFNIKMKWSSFLALLFMMVFTPVTLYLALQEQVSGKELVHDCGCFGDALILTNWQTFFKNIIILLPVIFIYINRNAWYRINSKKRETIIISFFILLSIIISIHAYQNLPFIDFRPYKIGADLKSNIKGIPDEEEQWATFKNMNTGELKDFEIIKNYPDWNIWEYIVDQKIRTVITKKGVPPSIHDFLITNNEKNDVTDSILEDTSYNFLFVSYDIEQTAQSNMNTINALYTFCKEKNIAFRGITASLKSQTDSFKEQNKVHFSFYFADPITLKTIIRANPGIVLLKKGIVINKWHYKNVSLPTIEKIIQK